MAPHQCTASSGVGPSKMCRTHLLSVDRKRLQRLQALKSHYTERLDRNLRLAMTCRSAKPCQTSIYSTISWQYPMSPGLWLDEPGPEAQSFALGIISTSRAQIVWGRLGGHGVDYRIQPGDVVQQSQNTKRNFFLESTNNFLNAKWFTSMNGLLPQNTKHRPSTDPQTRPDEFEQDSLNFVTPRHLLILHAKTQWWRSQCHHPRKLLEAHSASGTRVKTASGGTPNPKRDAIPDSARKLSGEIC